MAKTRAAKTSSPSGHPRAPRVAPVQGSITEPSQPLAVPPSVKGAPLSSPLRRYEMRIPPTTLGASSSQVAKSGCHSTSIPEIAIMIAYDAEPGAPTGPEHPKIPQPECLDEPQPVELPTDIRAPAPIVPSIGPMPKVAPFAPPAAPGTLPVAPATSKPRHPSKSSIAIFSSDFRGLCHTLQTLTTTQSILTQQMTAIRAHQDQIIATQTQHTVIPRQIQQHLGILAS
ncbi:hypothetical protein AAG906_015280 [Vitis piasezkii]